MVQRSFHIITFGCQMNVNDSDWLTRSLTALGFSPAPFGEAGVYILNTCSVRDKAEHKVYSEIGRIRHLTGASRDVLVCVGGCVAQQVGEKLFSRFPQVRLVFGSDGIAAAPQAIDRLVGNRTLRTSLLDFADQYEERGDSWTEATAQPSSFVSIMQGCNNYCAYCIVPYVRGRQRSRAPEAVLDECHALLGAGAREITLLGQNVNAYGHDGGSSGASFTDLLYQVAALPGLARLRFVTAHPKDLDESTIEAFARLPILAPRLHLPLQSGSERILKLMGRRYDLARFRSIVDRLCAVRPDMHFSTDIIVGFPGETEEDFAQTLAVMHEIGFVSSFSFPYSDRPGTRAAMLPDKVDKAVKLARLSRLQEWQHDFAWKTLKTLVGGQTTVLLEDPCTKSAEDGELWFGKEDRGHNVTVRISGPAPARGWRGAMLPVRIVDAGRQTLYAEQCGEPW